MRTKPAMEFRGRLLEAGWRELNAFASGGHLFSMMGLHGKTILLQEYPDGHGFEVWRPVTDSNEIDATFAAVQTYSQEVK